MAWYFTKSSKTPKQPSLKRVLIIVYYWPPSAGSGVQRWLNFTKYLPDFDWQPVVYTPENPDFGLKDESLLSEINAKVEVIKKPIWEPYQLHRSLFGSKDSEKNTAGVVSKEKGYWSNWIRGNVFVPDPKVFWRKPSVKYLIKYLESNPVDAMISSGTPHSMHLIALDLKRKFPNLPWIADFRDPWTELDMLDSYHIMPWRMRQYQKMEKQVLKSADLTLTTSKVWAKDFERLGAKKAIAITNGFDEKDFVEEVKPYDGFVISHFGLLNHLRNPEQLWQALSELIEENQSFAKDFRLHLGGTLDPSVLNRIKSFPSLAAKLKVFPYLSHGEVVREYRKSSILLLLLFNSKSGRGNIPGKLFEYLASKNTILAFGFAKGDSAEIVEKTQNGTYFNYKDTSVSAVKKTILDCFEQKQKGQLKENTLNVAQYSRRQLTKKLSETLTQLIA